MISIVLIMLSISVGVLAVCCSNLYNRIQELEDAISEESGNRIADSMFIIKKIEGNEHNGV